MSSSEYPCPLGLSWFYETALVPQHLFHETLLRGEIFFDTLFRDDIRENIKIDTQMLHTGERDRY